MTRRPWIKGALIGTVVILLIVVPFWYGTRADNPVAPLIFPPSPTPLPDTRMPQGTYADVGFLQLRIDTAQRIQRLGPYDDLGIITVTFKGSSKCSDEENAMLCVFDRTKFKLFDKEGREQTVTTPPAKYIAGLKIVQLSYPGELNSISSETGQIYFLLNKESEEFTLTYPHADIGKMVAFKLFPKLYDYDQVIQNFRTTPQPWKENRNSTDSGQIP